MSRFSATLFGFVFINQIVYVFPLNYDTQFGSFSVFLDKAAKRVNITDISFEECRNVCSMTNDCWFVNYQVTSRICSVVGIPVFGTNLHRITEKVPNYATALKRESTTKNSKIQYDTGCGPPQHFTGARILGNMQNVGSKVQYICNDNETMNGFSECLSNNTWSEANITCGTGQCHEVSTLGSCYRLTEYYRDWNNTKTSCEAMGGYLADIADESEMDHVINFLHSKLKTGNFYSPVIYIGLKNIANSSEFRRRNGKLATFFYWNSEGPYDHVSQTSTQFNENNRTTPEFFTVSVDTNKTLQTYDQEPKTGNDSETEASGESETERKSCVSMLVGNDFKWTKTNCEEKHPSLCEFEREGNGSAEPYWFQPTATTWAKAKKKCRSHSGYLVDILDDIETKDVSEYILDSLAQDIKSFSNIFIGLSNRQNKSEYRWMNNEIATYFNWEIRQTLPNLTSPYTAQNRCVALMTNMEYKWMTVSCYDLEKGLCEFDTARDDHDDYDNFLLQ